MKKNYQILFAFVFISSFGFSQTVEQKQMALFTKMTATWCNPCGTWGWTLFEDVYTAKKADAVCIEIHSSSTSQLYTPVASTWMSNFTTIQTSTPQFLLNGVNRTQYSSTGGIFPTSTKTVLKNAIDSTALQSPIANSGFTKTLSNGVMSINAKVKFFQNTTGEYYLGVYLVEKDRVNYQNGIGNSAVHKVPLRASVTTAHMGNLIVNGAASAGQEFTSSYSYTLDPTWVAANMKVVTIIWKKNGSDYDYVNAFYENPALGMEESMTLPLEASIYPSLSNGAEMVTLDINSQNAQNVSIQLMDQMGKVSTMVYEGKLETGSNVFSINADMNLPSGMYFVRIVSDNAEPKTLKMMVTK
ncbi:MAG: Omp28-related outer membrane protein [Crocinitomicaceae bacterium]